MNVMAAVLIVPACVVQYVHAYNLRSSDNRGRINMSRITDDALCVQAPVVHTYVCTYVCTDVHVSVIASYETSYQLLMNRKSGLSKVVTASFQSSPRSATQKKNKVHAHVHVYMHAAACVCCSACILYTVCTCMYACTGVHVCTCMYCT